MFNDTDNLKMLAELAALADIQSKIVHLRIIADETADPEKRAACHRMANAIEQHARLSDTSRSRN